MLNYETLLSSYDDKLTLMQWLKKVEEALKDASAVSFKVNKRGDATLTFSVVFEDGSELETDPIILQQGESVQAATIRNGHLILTLTNGDELDAGDLGAVSGFSINASQHLIVTYQNGTTQDLGAIFTGDVTLAGNLTAVGIRATGTGIKTSVIQQEVESGIDVFAYEVNFNNDVSAQGTIASDTSIKTPALTSDEDEISAQKPVIEVMTGYSFVIGGHPDFTLSNIYAGVVKNANKVTFVIAGEITKNNAVVTNVTLGTFTIPYAVARKLITNSVGGSSNFVDNRKLNLFYSFSTSVDEVAYIEKNSSTTLMFAVRSANMAVSTKYYLRYEATFLLSDNLAA